MANRIATVKLPLGRQGHSAYIALGDDELRRWETHCRGLEDGEMYPWAVEESRALITSILGCLFGEELSQLEMPSRAWARTNSTMAIFNRRLGCLRELVGQESIMNGPDSFDRLQEIFDKVTIVATEAALASLAYVGVSNDINRRAPTVEPTVLSDSDEAGPQRDTPSSWRRRIRLTLTMAAIAVLVAGLAFVLTSPSTAHHRLRNPGHTTSNHAGTTTKHTTGGAPLLPVRSGSGTTGPAPSNSSTIPGAAGGVSRTGSSAGPGNSTAQDSATSSGTSGSGAVAGPGGETTVTLPGGGQLTVPPLTVP
jgi:hypothetical protein